MKHWLILTLSLLAAVGCRNFETGMDRRLAGKKNPKEVYYEDPENAEDRPDQAERIQNEMAAGQAASWYEQARRAHLAGELFSARHHLRQVLKLAPRHRKAKALLATVRLEIAALPPDKRHDPMLAEERIAFEKALVEVRRRMRQAAALIRSRDFSGADEELRLAMDSTRQLPEGLARASIRYRIASMGQFAKRLAAEAGFGS